MMDSIKKEILCDGLGSYALKILFPIIVLNLVINEISITVGTENYTSLFKYLLGIIFMIIYFNIINIFNRGRIKTIGIPILLLETLSFIKGIDYKIVGIIALSYALFALGVTMLNMLSECIMHLFNINVNLIVVTASLLLGIGLTVKIVDLIIFILVWGSTLKDLGVM